MKTLFSSLLVLTTLFTLQAQNNALTFGAVYRNTNTLSYTGHLPTGPQLGYSHDFSDALTLQTNIGFVTNHWDVERGGVFAYRNEERTGYVEAFVLFPFLDRLLPKVDLRAGVGYIGSRNTQDYAEDVLISDGRLVRLETDYMRYDLHEIGIKVDYTLPLSDRVLLRANVGGSGSVNRAPGYATSIARQAYGTTGTSLKNKPSRHLFHYQTSLSIGYRF